VSVGSGCCGVNDTVNVDVTQHAVVLMNRWRRPLSTTSVNADSAPCQQSTTAADGRSRRPRRSRYGHGTGRYRCGKYTDTSRPYRGHTPGSRSARCRQCSEGAYPQVQVRGRVIIRAGDVSSATRAHHERLLVTAGRQTHRWSRLQHARFQSAGRARRPDLRENRIPRPVSASVSIGVCR
jgi:hypothetical protein